MDNTTDNIKLEDCYDAVAVCKKCKTEYGYDLPSKYIKKVCGKRIKLPGFKSNMLCPVCDNSYKDKPKDLNTSESINNHPLEVK